MLKPEHEQFVKIQYWGAIIGGTVCVVVFIGMLVAKLLG